MINLFILFQVCKRWQIWVDQIKLKELAISRYFGSTWNWFYTADSIDQENVFTGDLNFFQSIAFDLDKLKRLRVYGLNSKIFKAINKLIYLEHLELFQIGLVAMETTLNLPILKILYIDEPKSYGNEITIDAPMLKCFAFYKFSLTRFKILNPGSITHLEAGDKVANLDEYASVEVFKMNWPYDVIDQNIIQQLPKLREFHMQQDVHNLFDYETAKLAMNHILEQKVVHGKHDLKVYFLQHLLEPVDKKFEDYDFRREYNIFCDISSDSSDKYYSSDSSNYFYQSSDSD